MAHRAECGVLVFTAEGIDSCESPGSCADNIFCGYHGDFTFAGQHVIYANMPFGSSWGCDPGGPYPNDIAADTELDTASHEHFEAVTDPLFASNSWLDPSGDEIGDKCVFFYGARASDGHNVMLNQHPYLMQTEWSNREADGVTPNLGCSKGYVHFLPVLLFGN